MYNCYSSRFVFTGIYGTITVVPFSKCTETGEAAVTILLLLRIFRCENVVNQTTCLITFNALVRVSHRMVSFSELLQHLISFYPDSDLVFLLPRFLLTSWSFIKPWWDCDLLCWSRTSWSKSESPLKLCFQQSSFVSKVQFVPWTDITLKINKPSSSQFSHRTKRGLIILHVYFVCLFFFFSGECYCRQWLPVSATGQENSTRMCTKTTWNLG